jgi:hypothetical protein
MRREVEIMLYFTALLYLGLIIYYFVLAALQPNLRRDKAVLASRRGRRKGACA